MGSNAGRAHQRERHDETWGGPVALYHWVLQDPEGLVIHDSLGDPNLLLTRSARVLGGTFAAPEFHLSLYRGGRVAKFTRSAGADVSSLPQRAT